jgi:N6-L-threonylcarbamoyladenine synthase
MYKTILGIETSCDETAAAVLQKDGAKIEVLSSVISSSAELQAKFGGVIPEQAAREQLKAIIPVINEALDQAFPNSSFEKKISQIDAIAVTYGPGLTRNNGEGFSTIHDFQLSPLHPLKHFHHQDDC